MLICIQSFMYFEIPNMLGDSKLFLKLICFKLFLVLFTVKYNLQIENITNNIFYRISICSNEYDGKLKIILNLMKIKK